VRLVTRRDVDDAIRTSTQGWGTVTIDYSTRRAALLEARCSASAKSEHSEEYWGVDDTDGTDHEDWCVRLRRAR
jgi:hypothetical protein